MPLAELFLTGLPEATRDRWRRAPGVEEALAALVDAARAAWPGVQVPDAAFAPFLAAKLDDDDGLEALRALRAGDLYLACACAAGNSRAIAELDRLLASQVERALRRLRAPASVVEEVRGRLRERLLLPDGDAPPRVADFAGRGELEAWLRVSAVRDGLRLLRSAARETAGVDFDQVLDPAESPEIAHMKQLYRREFVDAFGAAAARLGPRERNLLRYHHLDGLGIDALASIYKVHRATAARWLASARETLIANTREELARRVGLTVKEIDSILRMIQSQIEVSVRMIFKTKH